MTPDVYLLIGIFAVMMAVTSAVRSWIEKLPPYLGGVLLIAGVWMIYHAEKTQPDGYAFSDLPGAVYRVFALVF